MKQSSHPWLLRGSATGGLLALCSLFAIACSATEPAARQQQPIAGGTQDVSHESVFLLVQETQDSGGLCTATLIAPNLLLTARHCVSPGTGDDHVVCGDSVLGDPYPASAFIATNDPAPSRYSQLFRAAEVRVPGLGVDTCGYDVALIILQQNVPSSVSTPAVPRIDREVHPGETYTAVGYGVNEAGNPNHSRMQLEGLSVECQPGSCGDGIESTEFLGETGICPGDSGGPALDNSGKVVGVVSRGGTGCSTPVYSTVTAWQDFLVQTAQEAAELGGYEAPFWVTTGSSDPPVLAGAGGAGGAGAGGATGASSGEACNSTSACDDGLVCYAEAGSARGVCVTVCRATSDCSGGQECTRAGDVSVCAVPTGSGDERASCAVSMAPRPTLGWTMAALGALVFARRRARRVRAE